MNDPEAPILFEPIEKFVACPACGLKQSDFYNDGNLGCPECYKVFEPEVIQALKEIHGGVQHIGKI